MSTEPTRPEIDFPGDEPPTDFPAMGAAITVAARLESLAPPGDILISESTARLVSGYVRTEPLGDLTIRGKDEPV